MEDPSFYCEKCGRKVRSEQDFCPGCGQKFYSVLCPSCGFSGAAGLFNQNCPACGYPGSEDNTDKVSVKNFVKTAVNKKQHPAGLLPPAAYKVLIGILVVLLVFLLRFYLSL